MCGLKSSSLRGPPFSVRTSRSVSCCAYLGTSLVICLPPIVNLHKLTGNLKHSDQPNEQCNCEGPLCRSVQHCGKKGWKKFHLFRNDFNEIIFYFSNQLLRLSILSSKYCLNISWMLSMPCNRLPSTVIGSWCQNPVVSTMTWGLGRCPHKKRKRGGGGGLC